jgi:transposase-like protein
VEVADELRSRILRGVLRPGERMPTQARIADEFGVERGAVRRALRILQSEHLLGDISRGSPATVAGPFPATAGALPGPTTVALGPRVAEAFAAPHVEVDALCLNAVSLALAVGEPLRRIQAGELEPARIDLRVLMPSRDIPLAFPTPVPAMSGPASGPSRRDEEDPVRRHWLETRNAQGRVLRHNLLALRATHGIDVRVTFRALPFTPPVKLYLLNGAEALFAYYTLARVEERIGAERLQLYDTQGTQAMLFPFEQDKDRPRDTTFVEQSQLWFNALWETISSELVLN